MKVKLAQDAIINVDDVTSVSYSFFSDYTLCKYVELPYLFSLSHSCFGCCFFLAATRILQVRFSTVIRCVLIDIYHCYICLSIVNLFNADRLLVNLAIINVFLKSSLEQLLSKTITEYS